MSGQKGRSGGARRNAGRQVTNVYRVIIEQVARGQASLSWNDGGVYVQFFDEPDRVPLKELAYSQEIGLYDKRRFPNLAKQESNDSRNG